MNQQYTQRDRVLKRNKGGAILGLVSAVLFLGLAGVFIYLLGMWGPDPWAIFFILFFLTWAILLIYSAVLNLTQPKITITPYNEIIIGNKKETFNISNMKVDIYKEDFKGGHAVIVILFGLLPGTLFFMSLGLSKLIFTCNGKKYILRSLSKNATLKDWEQSI